MDAFWNLGFVSVKPLEVLLSRDDVTLYDVLDDRNLFNECKEQNPKLIAHLSRSDNLKRLLQFVMDRFDEPGVNRTKFQHIATEVLCSDIDAFVDACLANDDELLRDFWTNGMTMPRDEQNNVLMTHFCKVFVAFLTRKPHEIFVFIQRQKDSLQDVLYHLEMPQVADMLLKLLLLDRDPTNEPVVDWLCEQDLMKQLVEKLSAQSDTRAHQPALELLKNVILMSSFTPTPGRREASVLSSNRLSRDLVSSANSALLITNIFPPSESSSSSSSEDSAFGGDNEASVSSFMSTAASVMELIRKNNSDYFEQYLFLRAREHLMAVQENFQKEHEGAEGEPEDVKPVLEAAMDEIMTKCGLVNLSTLISAICDRLHLLQERLKKPYSSHVQIPSTVGPVIPLTAERLRVCELYGELLHYSNMLLPNRIPHTSPFYDDEGKLVGGLDALGDLAAAMMAEADPEMEEEETDEQEEEEDQIEPSPFPVSQQNRRRRSFASDSDSDSMFNQEHETPSPGEAESGTNNEFTSRGVGASPASSIENMVERLSLAVPGSPGSRLLSLAQFNPGTPPISSMSKMSSTIALPIDPEVIADDEDEILSPGDHLKRRFLELGILSTLLDLVFQFPWNNFLHSVVYDILHQVLFGKVEGTLNRELIISLFRDVQLPQRILDAQARNDSQDPKEPRLGYMGHIALIAVDIIGALEKYPDDLLAIVEPLLPQPGWEDYVHGAYAETQRIENIVLGGPKPVSFLRNSQGQGENGWGGEWNDGEDLMSPTGEFKRGPFSGRQTADFGTPDEEEEGTFHFNANTGLGANAWGSGSSSDDEDEHEAWIKNSESAAVPHHSRDLENVGFDDSFGDNLIPSASTQEYVATTQEEDDGFGAFTNADNHTASQFSDNFGHEDFDFGEFQSSEHVETTGDDDFGTTWSVQQSRRYCLAVREASSWNNTTADTVEYRCFLFLPSAAPMTNRGQEIKISLKDRIAALGLDGHGATSSTSSTSNATSNLAPTSYSSGSSPTPFAGVRDKAARFESIGGVPVPRGSFGLGAPPAFGNVRKTGELYGNRIPSGTRSTGSSPGRSPADDSANIDFTRIRLRSVSSVTSMDEPSETEASVKFEVMPPTPAFPITASDGETVSKQKQGEVEFSSSPTPSVPENPSEIIVITTAPSTEEPEQVANTEQVVTIPNAIRAQELEAIPESPSAVQTSTAVKKPPEKSPAPSRRRSLILAQPPPSNVARRLSAALDQSPVTEQDAIPTTPESRSDILSPESTASPRRTRSLAPSRASSISSNSSVFTSPPHDEGEISGGGSTSSPTLAAVNTDQMDLHELPETPDDLQLSETKVLDLSSRSSSPILPIDSAPLPLFISNLDFEKSHPSLSSVPVTPTSDSNLPSAPVEEVDNQTEDIHDDSSGEEPGNLLQHEIINASELFYHADTASTLEGYPERTSSLGHGDIENDRTNEIPSPSASSPVGRLQEVIAETASPARVLRELRQLGMEKMTSIVIPPKRASVLSMMLPTIGPESSPSSVDSPSRGLYRAVEEQLMTAKPRESINDSTTEAASLDARLMMARTTSPMLPQSRPVSTESEDRKEPIAELSPSAASINSASGTSYASHGQHSSSRPSVDAPRSPLSPGEPLAASRTPTGLARFTNTQAPVALSATQKSYIPFGGDIDTQSTRNLTPSPPPSFRSLYASGRLPPSSRGPGPHLPSGKVPLIQRAVTLMSRALPPIPKEELPPRRSSSAFHVLRSRTSSKVKKKAAEQATLEERSSTSSDLTATDHGVRTRLRTKSSPSSTRPSSEVPPPIPQIPPVVILNDDDGSTPIARMFMEQRQLSQRANESQDTPPSAFRSGSPSPSFSSTRNSISSYSGPPVHLFTPSFDQGIFDSFPEVPHNLPTDSMVARHTKQANGSGHSRLRIMPSHSYSDLQGRGSYESDIAYSKSDDGHGTVKSSHGTKRVDEFGNPTSEDAQRPPARRKPGSRKLIPGWYDEEDQEEETGWASVSVVRRRLV